MTRLRLFGLLCGALSVTASLFALASGCSTSTNDDAAPREATWAITAECNSCLKDFCGASDGEAQPYVGCSEDLACSDAFAAFANCYKLTRSLGECRKEVDALTQTGTPGRHLLQNCFLLDCFDEICEGGGG